MSLEPATRASASMKQRALALAQPLTAHLELTYRCNWRCVFCYNPRRFDETPLSVAEWTGVLDELRRLGTLTAVLTGGEPLAHPGFFEIAEAVRERALAFMVFTNGALVDDARADRLAALDPLAIELSLHGASARTHDEATLRPGSFGAMMGGLSRLIERRLRVRLKTPLTRLNGHELEAMIALAEGLGVPYRVDPTVMPRDDGDQAPLAYALSREGLGRTYRLLAAKGLLPTVERDAGGTNCGLGRITLAVDPEGNVFPCLQWRKAPLTNVRRQRLSEVWGDSAGREEAAGVGRAANDLLLRSDPALANFPFCPGLALQQTGDGLGLDDAHRLRASIAEEVRRERGASQGTS